MKIHVQGASLTNEGFAALLAADSMRLHSHTPRLMLKISHWDIQSGTFTLTKLVLAVDRQAKDETFDQLGVKDHPALCTRAITMQTLFFVS